MAPHETVRERAARDRTAPDRRRLRDRAPRPPRRPALRRARLRPGLDDALHGAPRPRRARLRHLARDDRDRARASARRENVDAHFDTADYEQLDLEHAFDACLTYDALHHSANPERVLATAHRALKPGGALLVSEPNWKQRFQGRDATAEYGTTELGYSPRRLKRLLKDAGFTEIRRFHNNRKRLFGNRPADVLAHLAEPLTYRLLAPFWTQVWLRARAR